MTLSNPKIGFIRWWQHGQRHRGRPAPPGLRPEQLTVVEPFAETAAKLKQAFGIAALPVAGPELNQVDMVVWAVKPQYSARPQHRSWPTPDRPCICRWPPAYAPTALPAGSGSDRVVRCMPNTPALVGQGITGLFACPAVTPDDKALVEQVMSSARGSCSGLSKSVCWTRSRLCRVQGRLMCSIF